MILRIQNDIKALNANRNYSKSSKAVSAQANMQPQYVLNLLK